MKGIAYGLGQTNIDMQTGIRFGVIPSHYAPVWYDESEIIYLYTCPKCGLESIEYADLCESCGYEYEEDEFDMLEASYFEYNADGYACTQSRDDADIFIEKSKYYTYADLCSPCAPGACYLLSPIDEPDKDNKCYCFSHDWFDNGKAPYPVYSVETNEPIEP